MPRLICDHCQSIQDPNQEVDDPCPVCGSDAVRAYTGEDADQIQGIVSGHQDPIHFSVGDELHADDHTAVIQRIDPMENTDYENFWLVVGDSRADHWFVGSVAASVAQDDGAYELVKSGESMEE